MCGISGVVSGGAPPDLDLLRAMMGRLGHRGPDGNGYYRGQPDDIVRMLDMDYGDSVDSLRLGFDFGKDRRSTHTLEFSWDWAATGPTTAQLFGNAGRLTYYLLQGTLGLNSGVSGTGSVLSFAKSGWTRAFTFYGVPSLNGVSPSGIPMGIVDAGGRQIRVDLPAANGLALEKIRVVSAFDSRVKYNLFATFAILAAHQRRHLWQAERVRAAKSGTPAGAAV